MIIKKDHGDGSFDILWLEDEAQDTARLEDLRPDRFLIDSFRVVVDGGEAAAYGL